MNKNFIPDANLKSGESPSGETSFNAVSKEGEFAKKVQEKTFYSGFFVENTEEFGRNFPAKLENPVKNPHVTLNFAPNEMQLHLEELGSDVEIFAIGYGNDGKNEGLLVRLETDNPVLKEAIKDIKVPHITLSCSKDSHPMYTSRLEFSPLETPVEITGRTPYCLHLKDGNDGVTGPIVDSMEKLEKYI